MFKTTTKFSFNSNKQQPSVVAPSSINNKILLQQQPSVVAPSSYCNNLQ